MLKNAKIFLILILLINTCFNFHICHAQAIHPTDPLPSWNNGTVKNSILDFVRVTTDKTNPHYVLPVERIATFDQDGTTWVEQPMYAQVVFALDRVVELAPQHPEWQTTEPFKSILTHDKAAMATFTKQDLERIVVATHTGITVEAFQTAVQHWLATAKHPRWNRPYTELVYQPMLELIHLLQAHGYKIYIVTGGGQDFVRAYALKVYGIPPEQIIGSTFQTHYSFDKQKKGILSKTMKLLLNDNYSGKPEDIYLFIGHRPYAAFGNSTGDQQMLEYTQSGGPHLMLLVHHDDAKREYSYGSQSKIGTFSDALMTEAKQNNWLVVSMKNDWKRIFKFEK